MQREIIEKEVVQFLSQQIGLPLEKINVDDELKNLGMDSFQIIEMVLFIERKFGIAIPDHAYTPGNLKSVASIVKCAMEFSN